MRRWLLASLALALLASCGFGGGEEPAVREDERRAGAELHPRLLAEFGGAHDAPEAAYVRALGERVAAAADLAGQCTFTLVNSDVVNAFAVPGCYIYVTRGMMAVINSEAELAAVLGHELGHIVAAHSRRQQRRSLLRGLGVAAVELVTGSERLTELAGAAAGFFTLRYSRRQEYEADDLGIGYLAAAGFDPHAAGDMLAALGRQEEFQARTRAHDAARSIPEWARTHPLAGNRVERAAETARATGIADEARPENEARYLGEVDGLLYGDDPAQGFVLGRRFAHPVMRIGFEAPPGFTLTNSPQAIRIEGPDGARGEFAGARLPAGGLEAYADALLRQLLGKAAAEIGAGERTQINDVPALIVPAMVRTQEGAVALIVAAFAGEDGSAFHFVLATPPTPEARAALDPLIRSFRLLSPAEAATLRPLYLRTVTVAPGENAAVLAARMASEHPLDHFLMLNGLPGPEALRPGARVKIVAR
ncbi:MAG TPA: M48 family metalloprotease [Allosphingosinicella sp.]|jgi:predicted Zn-dependent protease